jgi:hypothetical protein
MRRTLRSLAALAILALPAAGCSNGSAGTARTNDNSAATVAHSKAVKFAECMRNNGVSGFPDPDASGSLTVDAVANGWSVDTNSAAWKEAIAGCKDLEPAGFTGGKVTPSQRTARLAFAKCVRESGVPDFPDPADDQPLVDTRRIPSSNTTAGMSALHAAMHTCGGFARAAGVTGSR